MSGNPQSAIRNPQLSAAIFIDRDGTLNEDIGYVTTVDRLIVYPWAAEAIRLINESGLKAIVITNQAGVARGLYTEETLSTIHARMVEELAGRGARIDGIYYCPHHPDFGDSRYRVACQCRKPRTGMLQAASRDHGVDLSRSFVIGDKASDINLALNAGARSALVLSGYGHETITHPDVWPCQPTLIAENLLKAVKLILDTEIAHG